MLSNPLEALDRFNPFSDTDQIRLNEDIRSRNAVLNKQHRIAEIDREIEATLNEPSKQKGQVDGAPLLIAAVTQNLDKIKGAICAKASNAGAIPSPAAVQPAAGGLTTTRAEGILAQMLTQNEQMNRTMKDIDRKTGKGGAVVAFQALGLCGPTGGESVGDARWPFGLPGYDALRECESPLPSSS